MHSMDITTEHVLAAFMFVRGKSFCLLAYLFGPEIVTTLSSQ